MILIRKGENALNQFLISLIRNFEGFHQPIEYALIKSNSYANTLYKYEREYNFIKHNRILK
jgi:hypothetical protein